MDWFTFQPAADTSQILFAEQVPVEQLAQQFGTPLYVYSRRGLETGFWLTSKPWPTGRT